MKKKIKNLAYYAICVYALTPLISFAQWTTGKTKAQEGNLPDGTITGIVTNVMKWMLGLVGVFGIIGFAIAGIFYLTAAGDEDKMNKGKNGMIWSIIGVIVALLGYVIIQAVDAMLGGESTTF
ncbi:pilin [Patescibacteria group bacterium]